MPVDPFRIQLLTVTLDSQVVLALVGLIVAGFAFRLSAHRAGYADFGAGTWWDIVTAAVVGARALWVLAHLDYYLRAPLQAVVVTDGGLQPVGLVLGTAYAVWRLARRQPNPHAWRLVVELVAVSALVAGLFERTGCALTTCGGGPPADLAWALRRGEELRQPIAFYQVAIVALALLLVTEVPRLVGHTFPVALAALALVEVVALIWGGRGPEGLAALLLAGVLALAASWRVGRRRAGSWTAPLPSAGAGRSVG